MSMAMDEISNSANMSLTMYPVLTRAAVHAILIVGSAQQKQRYVPRLVSGEWAGSMCLTESHCGTDLGLIRSKADPQDDGSYRVSGTKIFITAGEHDLASNIIHLVLARLPDAPAGIKGISMFIVPKYLASADGGAGVRNAVSCASIEEKMGIHGNATCVMNFDGATGYLIGAPNQGMRAMFVMMNQARLGAGVQGLAVSEVAYQNAAAWSKERLQGRALGRAARPGTPADPILVHPDVRRMLLEIRAFNEGARSLAVSAALMADVALKDGDAAARRDAQDYLALMTPVIKAYYTDQGFDNANAALQCFGGHGYIRETGVEQLVRDARITRIYEGTNGIQALDLVFRKLTPHDGRYLAAFFGPAKAFVRQNEGDTQLRDSFIRPFASLVNVLQRVTEVMRERVKSAPDKAAAAAADYLRLFGIGALAFEWSKMAKLACRRREESGGTARFYEHKIRLGRFYMQWIVPEADGLARRVLGGVDALLDFDRDSF
jgi:hypothetical protein